MVTALPTPTLTTDRLVLRPYRAGDFEAYAAFWGEPEVVRFIGGAPMSREASWTRFLRQIGLWHHLGFGFWAIEHKATGHFVGECGFHDLHRAFEPSIEGTMEAGWALSPSVQRRGLAFEAMTAAIGWAAAHGTGARLTALIDPDNTPSLKVAGRLGFAEFARSTYNGKPIVLLARPRQ